MAYDSELYGNQCFFPKRIIVFSRDELKQSEMRKEIDQKTLTSQDAAMTKLFCTEMLSRVSDEAIQICGGMGLMADIPLERIWRDARIERIWEGTSEIQRHIISRSLLRPLGA